MRLSPDEALKEYEKILKNEYKSLSESDTRAKYIDPLFINCLNWKENDIVREEHVYEGYIDYVFKIRGKNAFVIEAKKIGIDFTLPVNLGNRRNYKINGIISRDKNIKDALNQAQQYCSKNGARFGIITNGMQYIIFEAIKFGEDWTNGNAVIFYNLNDINQNFHFLWNILSKDAVEKDSLVKKISTTTEEFIFDRVVDGIHYRNERRPRNNLYIYMQPIIEYAFDIITNENQIEMLKECYVYDYEYEEMDTVLSTKFSTDMPPVLNEYQIKKVLEGKESAGIFLSDFYTNLEILKEETSNPLLFLLLGRIGSGKTTFVHRFFNIVLTEKEKEKILWFYVDFKDASINENEIRSFILKGILDDFIKKYQDRFNEELIKFEFTNIEPTLKKMVKLFLILRLLGNSIALVVDNVDQHRSSEPKFHEKIYLESNYLTKNLRTLTIMTLREESFYSSAIEGVFDAYYIKRYGISPPNFKKLILYRLKYILKKLRGPEEELNKIIGLNFSLGKHKNDIIDFLQIVKDSIQRSKSGGISPFISSTSGSDMRRALELFRMFLISGNTKINEILSEARSNVQNTYQIAYHQFVKSIMLETMRYYSGEKSYITNVYDMNVEYTNSHFLKLRILKYALDRISNDSIKGRGYISINKLYEEANEVFINKEAIKQSLLNLAKYGLIILDNRSRSNLEDASYFKITNCGDYYLNILSKRFVYVDLILADTPIADYDLVLELRRVLHLSDIEKRFERTNKFINYLYNMEERERQLHPEYLTSSLCKYRHCGMLKNRFSNERKYIKNRIRNRRYYRVY